MRPPGRVVSLDVSSSNDQSAAVGQAETREGSSTIEKRTPALWRFSSETARQASSASLRVLKGPCTWAEPSTSLWKFIEPNSPPITQKLLLVIVSLLSIA